jgi:hypothetical protein
LDRKKNLERSFSRREQEETFKEMIKDIGASGGQVRYGTVERIVISTSLKYSMESQGVVILHLSLLMILVILITSLQLLTVILPQKNMLLLVVEARVPQRLQNCNFSGIQKIL